MLTDRGIWVFSLCPLGMVNSSELVTLTSPCVLVPNQGPKYSKDSYCWLTLIKLNYAKCFCICMCIFFLLACLCLCLCLIYVCIHLHAYFIYMHTLMLYMPVCTHTCTCMSTCHAPLAVESGVEEGTHCSLEAYKHGMWSH